MTPPISYENVYLDRVGGRAGRSETRRAAPGGYSLAKVSTLSLVTQVASV